MRRRAARKDVRMRKMVLPFSADDGARAYFGELVGQSVSEARRALTYAERRLSSVGNLYDDPQSIEWHLEMELAEFLTWARQVRVSMHAAVRAAANPSASRWWDGLKSDEELVRFTERRNRALKRVEPASERRRLSMDVEGVPYAVTYFAFADEPHSVEPVYPRCQKHFFRLRELVDELAMQLPRAP
jgi:hypothetical protein